GEELADFSALLEEGFTDRQRLRELERNHALALGEAADLDANMASTEIQIGETRLQILQRQDEFRNEAANQGAEVQAQLQDIFEQIAALSDIVERTEVRAAVSGVVTNLQVHTEGGVIRTGDTIAEIVPGGDEL